MMFYQQKRYNGAEYTDADRIKESSKRRAMIEYVMLEGATSTLECAHQLGKLCQNRHLLVNLIPYNPTDVKDILRCPSEENMKSFQNVVSSYNTLCTIRRTMGADIASACGQLVVLKATENSKQVDIEDVGVVEKRSEKIISKGAVVRTSTVTKLNRSVVTVDTDNYANHDENDFLHCWIKPLALATTIAASCFVVSSVLYFMRRRGDRTTR